MPVTISVISSTPASSALASQPATIAAMIALGGVLVTVIASAFTNAALAKRRAIFEQGLAKERHQLDRDLASGKLADEREARAEVRREAAMARRVEFQRATLLELQEAMHGLLKATNDAQLDDEKRCREAGAWTKGESQNPFSDQVRKWQGRTQLLKTRIMNDDHRELVQSIKRWCSASLAADSRKASRAALDDATLEMIELNEKIGEQLRKLDDAEDLANHEVA